MWAQAAPGGTFWNGEPGLVGAAGRAVLILAALALAAYWLRRTALQAGLGTHRGGRNLRVVEGLALGPQRAVYLVEAAGRYLILGSTAHSVTLLAEITDPEVIGGLQARTQGSAGRSGGSFGDVLQRSIARRWGSERKDGP